MHPQSVLKTHLVSEVSLPPGLALMPSGGANAFGLMAEVATKKGAPVLGFAYRQTVPGEPFEAHIAGLVQGCKAGGPLEAGQRVMCDETGRVVPYEAGTPYHCIGHAVTNAKGHDSLVSILMR